MENKHMQDTPLWDLGYNTLVELETEQGILASGKEELYGCIFGRDSTITALKVIRLYEKTGNPYFSALAKKILLNLTMLQGKVVNIESGEEPGKAIHEYRPTGHEHLTRDLAVPWYLYPDKIMRNYDTVDATPLLLMAIYQYYRATLDEQFLQQVLHNVYDALDWVIMYGDSNSDGFVDYSFHPDRTYGGLKTQSWMDSTESLFHEAGTKVTYPIAPVEVQAYVYSALRGWSEYFQEEFPEKARLLWAKADRLKEQFNEQFLVKDNGKPSLAFAIDGNGKPMASARSSMGHVLWATWKRADGSLDSILEDDLIPEIAERLMRPDMFESRAGIRTLSKLSKSFNANSYHNGSIWPHDNAILIQGLENFGYSDEAARIRSALLSAFTHFQTAIEMFCFDEDDYFEYLSPTGQTACKKQAWSAAALLSMHINPTVA